MYNKEAIRQAVLPAEYLERAGYSLRPRGSGHTGPCPICGGDDSSTRFSVDDDVWHCFSCDQGGDIFTLHAKLKKVSNGEAIKDLGESLGLSPDSPAPSYSEQLNTFLECYKKKGDKVRESDKAKKIAQEFFATKGELSYDGSKYLLSRGLSETILGTFVDNGSRLFFPLYDFTGEIINALGRTYRNEEPKITQLPHGNVLGTLGDFSKRDPKKPYLLVEGIFDYLTALTLFLDKRYNVFGVHSCSNIPKVCIFMADAVSFTGCTFLQHNDSAGREAVGKGRIDFINMGVRRELIGITEMLEGCNDLNECLVKRGPSETRKLFGLDG